MSLQEEIDKIRQEIQTDGYSMSIGEWMSLYQSNEIDINPDFQRFFRWSKHQKSAFIESILLGIPIPPIFVIQRNDGVWDVVDGVQRLSTIYEFTDLLKKNEQEENTEPVALQKTTYLPSLEGKKWDDPNDTINSLTQTQRLLIRRAIIPVSIVKKESDEMIKYELFQRLHTGGSIATLQEVRNRILLMLNRNLYELMRSLADYEPFKNCISLSDRFQEERYDMELVLRFILLFDQDVEIIKKLGDDVNVFLTEKMREMALNQNLDYSHIETAFKTTFDILNQTTGDNSFKRYKSEQDRFLGGFLLSAFEVIALGIGYNYQNIPATNTISDSIKTIWSDSTYKKWSGAGVNAVRRLPYLIPLGREVFSPGQGVFSPL
ncbi:DUF262 domain-containing protein [Aphanizomenon sp. PH219]|uniref:DUF262 domain-containing protein n=1 Tax=Dolichospermum heterosporum TAC447 TaxID=747523 RepID=A0ABY5M642_9CYAN|nr:DUF262 domain-containing protein [Dolichospermum heterosporum]MDK2410625.1 DUF262 domain-containing protein [Aphanizomenon sp. 202]MDK2460004.1 DUF262 domain-containing protein [Aphanizomenon sp. PH219]UUO17324.1 DUF262 domain-containing protein [Dolichospermum heterosporum TAC447]